jgi:outer membrane protein, multidrug efflux system
MNAHQYTIMIRSKRSLFPRLYAVLLTLGACGLLAGCAVGPDYYAPRADVPAQWNTQTVRTNDAPPALEQWWKRLNDPLLDTLVSQAIRGNLDVATATARVREARALMHAAGGAQYPSMTGSGSLTRAGVGPNAVAGPSPSISGTSLNSPVNLFQAGFDASWEIDLFGANRRALEAARDGLEAAQWDLRSAQLTLIGDVTTRYVEARGYQARLALARAMADSQLETARFTRLRYEAGANSGLDAANMSGEAQTTLASIPALEAAYTQTVYSLSVLTGQAPGTLLASMAPTHPLPLPPLPVAMGVPADVLLARPDVRAAERRYAQNTARVGVAQAARYPRISLIGALGTSGTRFGDLARHSSIGWSIGPSITVPLFDGGQLKAAAEIADAQRDESLIAYQSTVLTALQDVENASVALSQETESVQNLRHAADAYGQAASMAKSLYRTGSTSYLEVLVADRAQLATQDALTQSQVRVATDYIALNKALGGGWNGKDQ